MCCIYQWFITSVLHFPGSRAELLWFTRGASPPELAQIPGSGCGRSGAAWGRDRPGPGQRDTSRPRPPADRTRPDLLRVIYCARPRSPPHPAPSVCPQACPALASSLRGARLVYLLQHRVIYKIFNKTRIFLTVTAAFLFTWETPFNPPAFGRPGRGLGGREGPDPGGRGSGLRAPGRPGRRRFANATKRTARKSFSFDFNKMQLGEGEVKLFPAGPMPPASGVGDARPRARKERSRGERSGRREPGPCGAAAAPAAPGATAARSALRPAALAKRGPRGGGKRPGLCDRPPVPRDLPAWETGGYPRARKVDLASCEVWEDARNTPAPGGLGQRAPPCSSALA